MPRHVQRHPLKGNIEHVDLLLVKRGEKVVVEVRIVLVGEPAAETLVNLESPTVAVEAEATHLPERIEVSIEGAEAGTQIPARDLVLPPGATLGRRGPPRGQRQHGAHRRRARGRGRR